MAAAMALEIRPYTMGDVPFGKLLSDGEGWPRTGSDWVRLVHLEPEGVFMAVADGIPAGTAAVVTFEKVAWIHSVIVHPDLRHRGIGEALLRACLDFVDRRGIPTAKLDSQGGVEPFYTRLGFREEYPSWRLYGQGTGGKPKVARLGPKDHLAVFEFDRAMTGLDRSRALQAILEDYPDRAFVARSRRKVRGYIILRRGAQLDPLGPWVADPADPGVAADLLHAVLAAAPGRTLRMCVGGYQEEALKIAEGLGFSRPDHSTRMFRGVAFDESRACYAMISAEKG